MQNGEALAYILRIELLELPVVHRSGGASCHIPHFPKSIWKSGDWVTDLYKTSKTNI